VPGHAEVIAAAPQLKAVCNFAVGYNNIDLAACTRRHHGDQHAGRARRHHGRPRLGAADGDRAAACPAAERWLRNGEWKGLAVHGLAGQRRASRHAGHPRHGAHRPGRGAARAGLRHEGDLSQPQPLPADQEAAMRAPWVDKETLLREADFLVLLLPYSPERHHIIGAAELALMKPTAHLINVARGGIVDDEALISALRQRRLSGAGSTCSRANRSSIRVSSNSTTWR
jgi:gluconate 2-dehydrogenase